MSENTIRHELEEVSKEIAALKKTHDASKKDLSEKEATKKRLEEQLKKFDAGLQEYRARYSVLKDEKVALERAKSEALSKENLERLDRYMTPIGELVGTYNKNIEDLRIESDRAETNTKNAATELEKRQKALKEAEKEFVRWAEISKTVESEQKELVRILELIKVDLKVGRNALAAYRLRLAQKADAKASYEEIEKRMSEMLSFDPERVEAEIEKRWKPVNDEQIARAKAEETLKEATATKATSQKNWQEAIARRDREIEQRLALMELQDKGGSRPGSSGVQEKGERQKATS